MDLKLFLSGLIRAGLVSRVGLDYPCSMVDTRFADATLMLVGHGSTRHEDSSAPVYQHAAALRSRRIFAEVREAFWKQPPGVTAVWRELHTPRIFIVPLFISEGYFSEMIIPRALGLRRPDAAGFGRIQKRGPQRLYYAAPVGTHPRMTQVILARAREVVAPGSLPTAPCPGETALFIAGHGTEKNENSRRAIEFQADCVRRLGEYAEVHAVFLEEAPRIADCFGLTTAPNLVVVPFFISDGLHVRQDIPVLLGEAPADVEHRLHQGQPTWRNPTSRQGKRLWYSRSVGSEPHLAEVILERVRELEAMGATE